MSDEKPNTEPGNTVPSEDENAEDTEGQIMQGGPRPTGAMQGGPRPLGALQGGPRPLGEEEPDDTEGNSWQLKQ
jgi:hypothetical protein